MRFSISLDGEYSFSLDADELGRSHLVIDMELQDADIDGLRSRDEESRFYNDSLHFLSFRPRSSSEIERYLRGRGADATITSRCIERLQNALLVDDTAFARYWIENRLAFSPRGARALQSELRAKGIDQDNIDAALNEAGDDESERAHQAAAKRAQTLSTLNQDDFDKKIYSFLQRRGFDYDVARAVTKRLWEENASPAHS